MVSEKVLKCIYYNIGHVLDKLIKMHEKNPKIVMWIDGGICSQLFRYVEVQYWAEKGY